MMGLNIMQIVTAINGNGLSQGKVIRLLTLKRKSTMMALCIVLLKMDGK